MKTGKTAHLHLLPALLVVITFLVTPPFATEAAAGNRYQISKAAPYSWYLQGLIKEMKGDLAGAYHCLETASELDPEAIPVLMELAQVAARIGKTEEAEQWIEQALVIAPKNIRLKLMLGRIYASAGNTAAAIEVLDDILKDDPDNEEALFLMGSLYAQSQKFQKAIPTLEKAASQKGTRSFMAHYYLGKIYQAKGEQDKALEEFSKAAAANPRFTPVFVDLAEIYEQRHDTENALRMWQRVLQNDPGNSRAAIRTIELLIKTGQIDQASTLLDRLNMTKADLTALRFKVALIYMQNNKPDMALDILLPLSEKHPDDSRILFYTALAQEENGEIDQAIKTLKAIKGNDMIGTEATVRIAFLLSKEDRNWEAVTFLKKRLEERPGNPQILLALSRIYDQTGQTSTAITLLEDSVKKGVANKEIYMQLAMLCEKLHEIDKALGWAQKALEIDNEYVPALNFIGYTWAEQGKNLKKAEEMIKKALSHQKEDGYIIDSLGWVYYAQGRYREAVQELEKAHKLVPNDPTIAEHLGDALIKSQKYYKALKIYRKAVELEKDKRKRHRLQKKVRMAIDMISEMVDQ